VASPLVVVSDGVTVTATPLDATAPWETAFVSRQDPIAPKTPHQEPFPAPDEGFRNLRAPSFVRTPGWLGGGGGI